jgi:integrase
MPRPRGDGTPAAPANRRKLTDRYVRSIVPDLSRAVAPYWDTVVPALWLAVYPSGKKTWRVCYRRNALGDGFALGDARSISVASARRIAARVAVEAAEGKDPKAERRAARLAGTFSELYDRYVSEWSRKRNKSWEQSDAIARRVLIPRWGKLRARAITRADVRALLGRIASPSAADAALAVASAVFTFGVAMEVIPFNPASGIARSPRRSRERVLSDAELRTLWPDLDVAFRLVLLTGARPGEVFAMRAADVDGAVWTQPGSPDGAWKGTKNGRTHSVQLSEAALALVADHLARPLARRGCEERLKKLARRRGIEKLTPHDFRRTFATIVARLGHGRQAVTRLLNHADHSVTGAYDRHHYSREDAAITDAVARHVSRVVDGVETDDVVVRLR